MIDPLPALLSVASAIPASVIGAGGGAVSPIPFDQTLDAFLDARDAAPAEQTLLPGALVRQDVAEDGKDLSDTASKDVDTPDTAATPFWFAAVLTPLPATTDRAPLAAPPDSVSATAPAIPQAVSCIPTSFLSAAEIPVATGIATPENTRPVPSAHDRPDPRLQHDAPPASRVPVSLLEAADALPSIVAPSLVKSAADPVALPLPKFFQDAATATTQPVNSAPTLVRSDPVAQAIAVSAVPQPAARVFAAALATAGSWRDRDSDGARTERSGANPFVAAPAVLDVRERAVVHAAADTAGTALDLTRDSGLKGIIDRIETLRDTADAGDTRVRLIPDALGSIDVAVRQDGDRVHVRFTAEHDATRALIAEAQPRLTELAAARGVRIGETSVSSGTGRENQPAPQPRPTPTFTRAPNRPARETESTTDHRLA